MKDFDSFSNFPTLMNIKDVHSHYLNFTHQFAKMFGWKSSEETLGKSDYDMPCNVAKFADTFREMDLQVISSGKRLIALDIQDYACGWRMVMAEKNPLKDNHGNVKHILSVCTEVTHIPLFQGYLFLHQFDNKLMGKTIKPASYIMSAIHSPLPLTKKQENCLFLLIRGKTIKAIARLLKISPRTVECHIEAIKKKLNCYNKSDLIEKAMKSGYLYYVPSNMTGLLANVSNVRYTNVTNVRL